jgi:hypothetical protein
VAKPGCQVAQLICRLYSSLIQLCCAQPATARVCRLAKGAAYRTGPQTCGGCHRATVTDSGVAVPQPVHYLLRLWRVCQTVSAFLMMM